MSERLIAALLVLGAVVAPTVAHAQSAPDQSADCPVTPDASADAIATLASDHYERGSVLYFQGDYAGAVAEYAATLCLVPEATDVLYSIGQAYERLLEFEEAIAYYRKYVDARQDAVGAAATERKSIESRITVLEGLRAHIQVTTAPKNATISFTDAGGVRRNFGKTDADKPFEVRAGTYTMRIELAGYKAIEETIQPRIGQPYSYFFPLQPKTGHLTINADPTDARIFVDDRLVGIGHYEADLAGDTYDVTIEANNRVTANQEVEVVADRTIDVPVKLAHTPKSGRTQLIIAAGLGGALLGGTALAVLEGSVGTGALGTAGGLFLGVAGAYFGVPRDIEVGESSYVITCAMAGAVEAGFTSGIFVDKQKDPNGDAVTTATIGGMAVGAIFGAVTTKKFHLDAGDAALLNTGGLWGGIGGGLFSAIFEFQPRVSEALVLAGLNLGLVTGALLGRRVEVSRGHVALIDLAGFAGMGISVAMQSAIDSARGATTGNAERTANFALGGMAVGLTAGAYMTRHMDAPKTRVSPTMSTAKDAGGHATAILGFGGDF